MNKKTLLWGIILAMILVLAFLIFQEPTTGAAITQEAAKSVATQTTASSGMVGGC